MKITVRQLRRLIRETIYDSHALTINNDESLSKDPAEQIESEFNARLKDKSDTSIRGIVQNILLDYFHDLKRVSNFIGTLSFKVNQSGGVGAATAEIPEKSNENN